ncbi:LWR-salt protein [Halobacteriales archaeon Cl-PHB]
MTPVDGGESGDDGWDAGGSATETPGAARYVFGVRFRLDPSVGGVAVEPATFETRLERTADPPGEPGWRFFRDNLWRGELSDPDHFRELTTDALGVTVEAVDFRELRTDEAYLTALKAEIAGDLDAFNADSTGEVLSKYLGSAIHVE